MKTPFEVYSISLKTHDSGSKYCIKKYVTAIINPADINSPIFKALWGSPPSFTLTKKVPIIDIIIPEAAINNGSNTAFISIPENSLKLIKAAPNTIAPIIEPTKDSNKSAPIPATSPTLSPTLSAIVAGFRGWSSGIPASTFPTKSAPTSAALVYIPPPTLANNAIEEAPRENPDKTCITVFMSSNIGL